MIAIVAECAIACATRVSDTLTGTVLDDENRVSTPITSSRC